jgi:iron complex transport system substrate-binding protein
VRHPAIALLLASVLLAVGCQSGFDEDQETAQPLKVAHALGEEIVPGRAERPVALSPAALDAVLALGVEPVEAALPGARLPSYLRAAARDVPLEPPLERADLPRLRRVKPDVALSTKGYGIGPLYDALAEFVPTVVAEGVPRDWKLDLRLYGEAMGRTNPAERLLVRWDEEVARARRSLPGDATASVPGGEDSFGATVLGDAGVGVAPPGTADVVLSGEAWRDGDGLLAARAALRDLVARLGR